EADGLDRAFATGSDAAEPPGGRVDDDLDLARRGPLQPARVERPRDERDRAVSARGRVALVVEEDDAEVGTVVLRLRDVAAVHVRVAARLIDEQAAHLVEVLERVAALGKARHARERPHAAGDDAKRLAGSVVVDGLDSHPSAARKRGSAAVRASRSKCSEA